MPVLAYWFLQAAAGRRGRPRRSAAPAEEKELRSPLQRAYVPVIRFATRRPVAHRRRSRVAVLLGTFGAGPAAEDQLLRPVRAGQPSTITQELPVGTSLAATDAAAKKVEAVLAGDRRASRPTRSPSAPAASAAFGRRRRRQPGHLLGHARRRRRRATLSDAPAHGVSTRSPTPVRSRVGRRRRRLSAASQLEVVVQAADAEVLQPGRRAGPRRRWPARPDVADVTTDLADSVPRIEVTGRTAQAAAAAGLTEAAIGAGRGRGVPRRPARARSTLDGSQRERGAARRRPPADSTRQGAADAAAGRPRSSSATIADVQPGGRAGRRSPGSTATAAPRSAAPPPAPTSARPAPTLQPSGWTR